MPSGSTCCLDKRGSAAEKSLLVCIEHADKAYFGEIKTFSQQIDSNENVEFSGPQRSQYLNPLYRVDVAVKVAYLQSDFL